MNAEIQVPAQFVGAVIGNIAKKRGQVINMSQTDAGDQIIEAEIPLAETFGWITILRSMTQGRAECSLQFSKYEVVPEEIKKQLEGKI